MKTITFRFYYLLLAIAGFIAVLLPSYVFAQEWKDGLVLRPVADGYGKEIIPGESETFFMEVANYSYVSTTDIRFTYDAPGEWVVDFKPQSIEFLNAGSFHTVEVAVTAPQNVKKGDYNVTIIADSDIGRRVTNLYVRVNEGTSLWMWIGGILGLIVIAVFVIIFIRYGRD